MSDLIYRDELKKTIKALVKGEVQQLLRIIDGQPRVDAKIEQHGHWVLEKTPDGKPYCFHCSVCDDDFKYIGIKTGYDYCPLCGAKMDGKDDEE